MKKTEEILLKIAESLSKIRDYGDDDDNNDENLEGQGFRVFDPDQEGSDDADKWLSENDPEKQREPEYDEYNEGEDEDAHQQEPVEEPAEEESEAPVNQKTGPQISTPEMAEQKEAKENNRFPQPTREDIAKLREYTRPWEQRARDTARLTAEAHKNPELHHQGHLIEARNKSHQDKQNQYAKLTASPEYKNADPITQMEMDAKFHNDYNKANPNYLKNAIKEHEQAHKRGAQAHDVHAAAKDEAIRHVLQGGAQAENPMSTEEGLQHAGGQKGEEGTTGAITQDKAASFAGGNQDFLRQYAKNYDKKRVKPKNLEEMGNYDQGAREDIQRILGDNPALNDPKKKAHMNQFFSKYYPLIAMNASRVMNKLGLDAKKSDLDLGAMHEAGMHGLMQAINDYNHDHPSKASFATHASNKIRGLQQQALKSQDVIPEELRTGAKKFQQAASQVKPQAPVSKNPIQAPVTTSQSPTPKPDIMSSIASSAHSKKNDLADRLKRIDTHRAAIGVGTKKPPGGEGT